MSSEFFKRIHVQKKSRWQNCRILKNSDYNSGIQFRNSSFVLLWAACTTIYEHDMWKFTLSDFFFISICWGASPTKIKQLAHLVGCIISTVLISQQYVKFLIRNPAYQNRIAQWSGKLLSRQHLCTGLRWFFFQEIKNINFLTLVKTNNKNNFLTLVKTNNKRLAFATTQQWYFVIKIVLTYTANIYRMVIGNFIGNPLSA